MLSGRDVIGMCTLLACIVTVADSNSVYRILLEAENNAIAGSVSVKARNGDRIDRLRETTEEDHGEITQGEEYLKVKEIVQPASTQTTMLESRPTVASKTSKAPQSESATRSTTTQSKSSADDDASADLAWVLPKNVQPAPHTNSQLHIIHSINYQPPPSDHNIHRRDATDSIHRRSAVLYGTDYGLNTLAKSQPEGGVRNGDTDQRSIVPNDELGAKQLFNEELEIMKDADIRIGVFVRQRRDITATSSTPTDQYVVAETTVFAVDDYGYIVVAEEDKLPEHTHVEFFVYVQAADGRAISNSVAFMVHVEHEKSSAEHVPVTATVFAGVLVLIVVLMALIIPLVTRAKRRRRQGKPMFTPGSHASRADLQNLQISGTQVTLPHDRSEPNWYGDGKKVFYSYEEEVARERKDFTEGLHNYAKGTGYATHTGATGNITRSESQPETLQLSKKSKNTISENVRIESGSTDGNIAASEQHGETGGYDNNAFKKDEVAIISSSGQGSADMGAEGNSSEDKQSHRF